jgi:hypothetical protein
LLCVLLPNYAQALLPCPPTWSRDSYIANSISVALGSVIHSSDKEITIKVLKNFKGQLQAIVKVNRLGNSVSHYQEGALVFLRTEQRTKDNLLLFNKCAEEEVQVTGEKNFEMVIISPSDLSDADIRGLDFRGTRVGTIVGGSLEGAIYDNSTYWPTGFDPKKSGAEFCDKKLLHDCFVPPDGKLVPPDFSNAVRMIKSGETR